MKKKQVILIMTDTQRKDMLSCYNGELDMGTPNLDLLASSGIRYERAYTCQPVCGPARSSIFTGTYPHTNGMLANCMSFNRKTKTIGERLDEAGIHAGYIGKWHLDGGDYFGDGICPNGWDSEYWYDMRNYIDELSDTDKFKSRQFESALSDDIPKDFTFAHRCSDRAVKFIENNRNNDFLLVVSYDEPHHPHISPKDYYEKFINRPHTDYGNLNEKYESKPEHIRIWSDSVNDFDYSAYGLMGCNSFVDSEIGRVLGAIDSHVEDALVLYTSDHGDALGAHGISNKGPAVYDEITNIPFIIRWKGRVGADIVSNQAVSHINIVPTILEFFELPIPESIEGKSMLPITDDTNRRINDFVFMEFTRYEIDHDGFGGYQPLRAVTDGRYKLAVNLLTSDELYDTKKDPGEMENLINDEKHRKIRDKLHETLLKWMNDTRDPFRGYYWERRPWRTDARQATWDYTGMTRQRLTEEGETRQLDYLTGLPYQKRIRGK